MDNNILKFYSFPNKCWNVVWPVYQICNVTWTISSLQRALHKAVFQCLSFTDHILLFDKCTKAGIFSNTMLNFDLFLRQTLSSICLEVQYFSKHPTFLLNRTDSIHQRISCNYDHNLYYEHDCAIKDTNGIAVQTKVRNQHFRITERKRLHDRALMKSWISNCNTRGAIKSFSANTYLSTIAQTLWALPFPVSFPIWKVIISLFKCAHWSSHKKNVYCFLLVHLLSKKRWTMKEKIKNVEWTFRGILRFVE